MKIFNPTVSGSIILPTGSAPVTSSGFAYIYAKTDGKIYLTQENGTEAEVGGGGGDSTLTEYTVTLNDAENTASEVTLFTFTVPANTWADGDVVAFEHYSDAYRSAGNVFPNLTLEMTGITNETFGWVLNTTITKGNLFKTWFKRAGSTLVKLRTASGGQIVDGNFGLRFSGNNRFDEITPFDFTVDFIVTGKITLPEASPDTWIRNRNAYAFKKSTGGYWPY